MEIGKYGNMEIWKQEKKEKCKYGNIKTGKYGNLDIWK